MADDTRERLARLEAQSDERYEALVFRLAMVEKVAYGAVGLICVVVLTAVIALVMKG